VGEECDDRCGASDRRRQPSVGARRSRERTDCPTTRLGGGVERVPEGQVADDRWRNRRALPDVVVLAAPNLRVCGGRPACDWGPPEHERPVNDYPGELKLIDVGRLELVEWLAASQRGGAAAGRRRAPPGAPRH